jgi:predicted MFS family arabinose efflux permease
LSRILGSCVEENRTQAMALVGMTIGFTFLVAIVAGAVVASWIGIGGIFWLMAALALMGIAITTLLVPTPRRLRVHREAETVPALLGSTSNLDLISEIGPSSAFGTRTGERRLNSLLVAISK